MITPQQQQEITELRSRNLTPKQIARKLGLRIAEVTAVIKSNAEASALALTELGTLAPIALCLLNVDAARSLLTPGLEKPDDANLQEIGLAQVLVARSIANRYLVATYLVDYWCLGVKDVNLPRQFDQMKYERLLQTQYSRFPAGYREITLQQAQAIVFGAIAYAAQLGFSPHPDFESAREHLGEWDGQPQLEFGHEGKPLFISGPYDDTDWVLNTLRRNVGEGNYHFIASV